MIGSRTKQVSTYGRRTSRIVDAAVGSRDWSKETPNMFDDLPPPEWAPIATKMRKKEDAAITRPKEQAVTHSPRVVKVLRKKKLAHHVRSPSQRRKAGPALDPGPSFHTEGSPGRLSPSGIKTLQTENDEELPVTPRIPLSDFPINTPASPAGARHKKQKVPQFSAMKRKSLGLKPPHSPVVDVEVIVLDDDGQMISRERRITRPNAKVDLPRALPEVRPKVFPKAVISDEDDNPGDVPKVRKLRLARRRAVVHSDDDSHSESETMLPITLVNSKPAKSPVLQTPTVEVYIPPASYAIPKQQDSSRSSHSRSTTLPQQLPPAETYTTRIPSPIIKPRQLTPIRNSRRNQLYQPPSPPSPTTPTDFDLSMDLSELNIVSPSLPRSSRRPLPDFPEYLRPLLKECHQEDSGPYEFSAFIESFPYDPVVAVDPDTDVHFHKIGEASYSEVFGIGDVVLKIIPLRDERSRSQPPGNVAEGPAPTDARDVQTEMIVTRAMGDICGGFVKLLKTYVVRGKYPDLLLDLWDDYNETRGSESIRPDTFTASQVYAIIALPNGGPDLETYTFYDASRTGWRQACGLFWQVAKSLAHAEQLVSFEHRDLHWGQILVRNTTPLALSPLKNPYGRPKSSAKSYMDDPIHGVQATIIDLGLARMDAGDGSGEEHIHWTPFEDEVFMGKGDYQFDIYRLMRDYIGNDWEDFNPLSNVMWLHYLAVKLIHSKRLKPPVARKGTAVPSLTHQLQPGFTEKECYECLLDIEQWLGDCLTRVAKSRSKNGRRKTQAAPAAVTPCCAGDIVEYAVKRRWVAALA